MGTNFECELKVDNSGQVLGELESKITQALDFIGKEATAYIKDNTPVRTGALRDSMDSEVAADEHAVYFGSRTDAHALVQGKRPPKEYVYSIEFGGKHNPTAKHMIQRALNEHQEEYKAIAERVLKG